MLSTRRPQETNEWIQYWQSGITALNGKCKPFDAATTDGDNEDDGNRLVALAASSCTKVEGSQEYSWIALKMVHSAFFIGCPNISLDSINDLSVLCQSFR